MKTLKNKKVYIEASSEGERKLSVQTNDPRDFPCEGMCLDNVKLSTEITNAEDISNLENLLRKLRPCFTPVPYKIMETLGVKVINPIPQRG